MSKNDGGQAFPGGHPPNGMSLRDWFAGMALQGLIDPRAMSPGTEILAEKSYSFADAMLAERGDPDISD